MQTSVYMLDRARETRRQMLFLLVLFGILWVGGGLVLLKLVLYLEHVYSWLFEPALMEGRVTRVLAEALAVQGLFVAGALVFFAMPLWRMFSEPQGTGDWLRLDGAGLTLTRGGRRRFWPWSAVSAPRRHGYGHPLALLRGRSLSLRVARAGAWAAWPRRLVLGDAYLTRIDEIADAVARTRAGALDRTAGSPGAAAVCAPRHPESREAVMFRRLPAHRPKVAPKFLAFLIVVVLGTIGLILAQEAWRNGFDWDGLRERVLGLNWSFLTGLAIILALMVLPSMLRDASAASNFVLLSDDGLHLRSGWQAHCWPWRDLSGFDLRPADPGPGPDRRAGRAIVFAARGDGTGKRARKHEEADPDLLSFAIEDIYDRPLEEILRLIERWHGRALETAGVRAPAPATRTFRWSVKCDNGVVAPVVALLVVVFGLGLAFVFFGMLLPAASSSPNLWVSLGAAVVGVVIVMGPCFIAGRLHKRARNALRLDAEGLTHIVLGWRRRWAWRELPAFEVRQAKLRWIGLRRSVITCAVPRDDWLSRALRWAYCLRTAQPLAVIEDVYDVPLEEIARALNDHRRGTLGPSAAPAG